MPLESVNLHTSGRDGKKSDFVPTAEEINTIQEKMKDPEFMKLMQEYMSSLEDPAYRKEEEEYLAQIEKEAKEGGDNSFDFIFPKESYFVELMEGVGKDKEGSRVFINMCTSDKIDEYKEESTNDRMASNWTVPVSISRPRPETFEGKPACVYDAAFHPLTLSLGEKSDRFMTFLVEIAVENINSGHKKSYGYGYRRMSNSSSKVKAVGQPQNMTVRRAGGKTPFEAAKEQSVLTGPTQFGKDGAISKLKEVARAVSASASTTASASNSSASKPAAASAATPTAPTVRDNLPPFTITHRGVIDLTDSWNWKVSDKRTGVPKQLVVAVDFEGAVTSAAAIEMDVSTDGARIDLHKSDAHPFFGSIVLPFTVEDNPSSAKFEKKKGLLTLVLDVKVTTIPLAELKSVTGGGGTSSVGDGTEDGAAKADEGGATTADGNTTSNINNSDNNSNKLDEESSSNKGTNSGIDDAATIIESSAKAVEEKEKEATPTPARHVDPTTVAADEPSAASSSAHHLIEEISGPAAAEKEKTADDATTTMSSASATQTAKAAPASGYEPDANERMREVMRKIEEARREREEAERIEKEAEEALREAEAEAEAARKKGAEEAKSDNTQQQEHEQDQQQEEQPQPQPQLQQKEEEEEEPVEVVDLRTRQDEWLKGVKENMNNKEEKHVTFNEAVNEAVKNVTGDLTGSVEDIIAASNEMIDAVLGGGSGGILDGIDEEEDEEALAKKREMRRKLREIEKQEVAAKEAERLEMLMKEKMAALPLRSHYIFEIE